jgi:rubrerythrin
MNCAPDVQAEIEAARTRGEIHAAGEKAANEGIQRGKKRDVTQKKQLVCPECGEANRGSKFCPTCGANLVVEPFCSECGASVQPNAKFCPECGEKVVR